MLKDYDSITLILELITDAKSADVQLLFHNFNNKCLLKWRSPATQDGGTMSRQVEKRLLQIRTLIQYVSAMPSLLTIILIHVGYYCNLQQSFPIYHQGFTFDHHARIIGR